MKWLLENAGTIVVSLALIGVVVFVVIRMRKDKKQGRSSCGGNCSCCPMGGTCHKPQE